MEGEEYLRLAGDVLEDQAEDVLDVWYGFVASHSYLVYYLSDPEVKNRSSVLSTTNL